MLVPPHFLVSTAFKKMRLKYEFRKWLPKLSILSGCPLFIFLLFVFCFLAFSSESLPGDDVLCRLLSRQLSYICLLPCLFVLFRFLPSIVIVPGLLWFGSAYLVTKAGFNSRSCQLRVDCFIDDE